jgi:hypothetical protein
MEQSKNEENKSSFDEQIYINVQQNYYSRLKDVTKKLRSIEKNHLDRVSRIYGVEGDERLQIAPADLD